MIILLKLLLAHFIGDFLLQPNAWVEEKESKRLTSPKLYLHALSHGALVFLLLWDWSYWLLAVLVMFIHGIIDILKIFVQKESTRPRWFLLDQTLHIISIIGIWAIWFKPDILSDLFYNENVLWVFAFALLFLTLVSGIIILVLLSKWTKEINENNDDSLRNAGKYIGILERLFVFTFVLSGNWGVIGFLLTAKSVFRFGDLKESKDRKLTEYILVGTLLSFGMAIACALLVKYFLSIG